MISRDCRRFFRFTLLMIMMPSLRPNSGRL